MKIQLTILLPLLIVAETLGQDRILSTDSDTTIWFKGFESIKNQIGLESIDKVKGEFYFRLWTGVDVIELRRKDNTLEGKVTFLVQQCSENKAGEIYFKKTPLTTKTTTKIYDLVNKYGILELPTDKQIKGWDTGFDGITYIIETADNKSFSGKTYWTPTSFRDKLIEAKQLADFLDEINEIEELNSLSKRFMDKQPFTSWYNSLVSR